ncbi:hypothetical protein KCW83_14670, partial [Staphylococcus aureus]|nr:hypothetical protein [Staphylococcus argenteus]MBS3307182.1 hypothetical protein [Staphylococcus aureus]MBS3307308.1 hypothetical protein [Staphylococcus aureus]
HGLEYEEQKQLTLF